jgi:hypothetical protein
VRDLVDFSKVTLTLGSNLGYGGSNDVLVTGVKDLALNTIVNNGVTNKACFCLSRLVFEGHMNLHLRTHSVPVDTFSLEGGLYPLTWSPLCDLYAKDDGLDPDAVAGDSIYTAAADFSRPSDCTTGADTTWIEYKFVHQCTEWDPVQHYYANPGLTCATGIDTFSVWWGDIAPDNYTNKAVDVIFQVDLQYYNPLPGDTVGVNGSEYPLNWNVPVTTFLKDDGVFPDSFAADEVYSGRVRSRSTPENGGLQVPVQERVQCCCPSIETCPQRRRVRHCWREPADSAGGVLRGLLQDGRGQKRLR